MLEMHGITLDSSLFRMELEVLEVNEDGGGLVNISMNSHTREFFEKLALAQAVTFDDAVNEFLLEKCTRAEPDE
jgi:hypothetical protein